MASPFRTDRRHPPSANRAVGKLLPRNLEAAVALLGSVLIDSAILPVVAGIARPEDCYREAHRIIYQAMCDLYESGTPPDLVTRCDELARRGKLDDLGGARSVSSLANQAPTSLNGEHYAAIVATKRTLRGHIDGAGQIAAVASNELMRSWRSPRPNAWSPPHVNGLSNGGGGARLIQVDSGIGRIPARALLMKTLPQPQWAVPGILPAGLTLLAGKPKMGTSWLALGLALAIAMGGVALESTQVEAGAVLYLALEDTQRRLQQPVQHRLPQVLPQDGSELGQERRTCCRQRRTTRAEVVARRQSQRDVRGRPRSGRNYRSSRRLQAAEERPQQSQARGVLDRRLPAARGRTSGPRAGLVVRVRPRRVGARSRALRHHAHVPLETARAGRESGLLHLPTGPGRAGPRVSAMEPRPGLLDGARSGVPASPLPPRGLQAGERIKRGQKRIKRDTFARSEGPSQAAPAAALRIHTEE